MVIHVLCDSRNEARRLFSLERKFPRLKSVYEILKKYQDLNHIWIVSETSLQNVLLIVFINVHDVDFEQKFWQKNWE